MSLWVYLAETRPVKCECGAIIKNEEEYVFEANITNNLCQMAGKANIYNAIWCPEEIKAKKAKDIINLLDIGYKDMKERADYFSQFDASNGWGTYSDFLPWVQKYLHACREYPDADIIVSK
jgi:hypothetical protein